MLKLFIMKPQFCGVKNSEKMFQIKHHLVFCWKSFQNLRPQMPKWGLIRPTKGCKLTPVGIRPWSEKCFQHSTIIQIGKSCTSTGERNKRHVWPKLYVVPGRLTARPWKMMVGRRSSPFGMVYKFSRASIAARLNFEGGIPLKINMQPKNHPIEKQNHLPNLHFWVPCSFSWG